MIANKPDILIVMEREGLELRRRGRLWWACCPFHEEKTPSFAVYYDSQRFCCFGCGEKGDVITFTMKRYSLTFREALAYLEIGGDNHTGKVDHRREARKKELLRDFENWRRRKSTELCQMHRLCLRETSEIMTADNLDRVANAFHQLPIIAYKLDILQFGENEDRLALYQEVTR